ncbi:MAG: outer membrane beta-barrel protein [Saprospiraceae bacterium]|nr:porin [Lewinella sp.]
MKMLQYLTIVALVLVSFNLGAQEIYADATKVAKDAVENEKTEPTTEEIEKEEDAEKEDGDLMISGFVDGYYLFNFNGAGASPLLTSFTDYNNMFTLGMANVLFSKEGDKVGFVADLAWGPRAEAANGTGEGILTAAIKQLYMTYAASDAVTFTFGNFSTFVGYELIDAPGNVNYSTSYLFSNGPFYHTGLKADFAFSESFGAMLGIFNDTDSKFDFTGGKHIGAQLSASTGGLSAYLNFITGKEEERGDDDLMEYEIDLTATYDVSDNFMLGLNVAQYGTSMAGDDMGGFFGAALYSTITASETFALGLRAESFTFKGGDGGEDASVLALTASGNITIGNLRLIPEIRVDLADEADGFFFDDAEAPVGSLPALILAAVYSF